MRGRLIVDLPEEVALEHQVAGVGARIAAVTVDAGVQAALLLAGATTYLLLTGSAPALVQRLGEDPSHVWSDLTAHLGWGLLQLWAFALLWGYSALFEIAWQGQTPGKRLLNLRVVRLDGLHVGSVEVALRNLLRPIDLLPVFYGAGGATAALTPLRQRLGDLAAGTVVVVDPPALPSSADAAHDKPDGHPWAALDAFGRARSRLRPDEVGEATRQYRLLVAALAKAQHAQPLDASEALRGRVIRARRALFGRPEPSVLTSAARFFRATLPRRVRGYAHLVALSAALVLIPLVVTWQAGRSDPGRAYAMASPDERANARAYTLGWSEGPSSGEATAAAAFYITSNTSVALRAFAGGLTAGVLTVWALVYNGVNVGTTLALVEALDAQRNLMAFVTAHGPIELLAICLAGAGGLVLAGGILRPGPLTRSASLAACAPHALTLALGSACLLVVAGLLEGLVSPSALSPPDKAAIGASTLLWVTLWFTLGGRGAPHDP